MLVHLAHPELSKRLVFVALASVVVASLGMATLARAADTLPVPPLDARSTGNLSDGTVAPAGSIAASLSVDNTAGAVRRDQIDGAGAAGTPAVTQAGRASVFLGIALAKRLELSLGLHGTSEQLATGESSGTGPGAAPAAPTGFADASLMIKAQLLEAQGFQLALAPFVESGAGAAAASALTRSVSPKGGAMAIASYGAKGVAEVTANAGVRYRNPETTHDVVLRNEQFYRAGVVATASRVVSLFLGIDGRRLMVASDSILGADGKLAYHPVTASAIEAGAALHVGTAVMSAFAAKSVNQAESFGYGDRTFGMSLAWDIGVSQASPARAVTAADAKDAQASAAKAPAKAKLAPAVAPAAKVRTVGDQENADVDAIGTNVDPLSALGDSGPDDFTAAEKQAALDRKNPQLESEDARIERELQEIKETEERADAARAKADLGQAEERRRQAVDKAKADDVLEREWMDEAKKSADALEGISPDQLRWNGLQ